MSQDRRENFRVSQSRLITEIVRERPFVSSITNLSSTGMFTVKPSGSGLCGPRIVQLEIPLPEASETVWATGRITYETLSGGSIGAGIRFLNMAKAHESLINDLVEYHRKKIVAKMFIELKRRKNLAACPSPYAAAPPKRSIEDTIKMYLLPLKRRRLR